MNAKRVDVYDGGGPEYTTIQMYGLSSKAGGITNCSVQLRRTSKYATPDFSIQCLLPPYLLHPLLHRSFIFLHCIISPSHLTVNSTHPRDRLHNLSMCPLETGNREAHHPIQLPATVIDRDPKDSIHTLSQGPSYRQPASSQHRRIRDESFGVYNHVNLTFQPLPFRAGKDRDI